MIVFTVPADDPDGMAFIRELYRRYARLMFAEALRRVSNPQDCEDIVQDAVESLCKKADTLRELPSAALPAYVVYTVKHKAFDFLRRQAVAGKCTADPEDGWLEGLESPAPSPEELAELREQTDGCARCGLCWRRRTRSCCIANIFWARTTGNWRRSFTVREIVCGCA